MSIKITSDSTCDLGELVKQRNIGIMPLKVTLDTETYLDGVEIQPQAIFDFVAEKKQLPKTSAPSITDYQEFFEEELKTADEILHFSISAKSSVSHTVARQAAEEFGGRVRVIDSMALSSGQGLLVLKAADLRDQGKSLDEIEEIINATREHVNTSFVPDSLEYLFKGGRVSRMTMYGANLLKIHPLIYMEKGQLVPGKKYRGKMSVCIKQYIDDLQMQYPDYDKTRCFVTHSSADKELVELAKARVKEAFGFEEVLETVAGSIITSHCGRNTLGVLFIYNK